MFQNLTSSFILHLFCIIPLEFSFVLNKYLTWSRFNWIAPTSCWHHLLSKIFRKLTISFVFCLYRIVPLKFLFIPNKYLIWSHFNWVDLTSRSYNLLIKNFQNLTISFELHFAALFHSNFRLFQEKRKNKLLTWNFFLFQAQLGETNFTLM